MLENYLQILELGYYEVQYALEGMADEHVWKRPADGLLSVGELAGHIAYWEAVRLAGGANAWQDQPDLEACPIKSLLLDHRFGYYPNTIVNPPTDAQRAMTAPEVYAELMRVHTEAVTRFRALNPEPTSAPSGAGPNVTYSEYIKYLAFHIAYHTGQMYSVRHLMGEQTPDN